MPVVGYHPEDGCLSLFIALRGMHRPDRVMVWLTENIQACLRDFQTGSASMDRKRHLASSGRGFYGFCLMAHHRSTLMRTYPAAYCPPDRGLVSVYIRGRCPRLLRVVPSRHQSAYRFLMMCRLSSQDRCLTLRSAAWKFLSS